MTDAERKEIVKYRINRAHETLREVDILIENQLWNTAVNRMYYACFYAVGALLIKLGVQTLSHSGTRQKFGQLIVKPGLIDRQLAKHYTELCEKRLKGDYNDFYDFDEETVLRLFSLSKEFINKVEELVHGEEKKVPPDNEK